MTAPTQWGAATESVQCHRCGRAGKVRRGARAHGALVFCTEQCRDWHNEDIRIGQLDRQNARNTMRKWERIEELRDTPLHHIYPGMLDVLAVVQAWRPSYCRWAGCAE